ncbi:MAG: HD domain-containing protein [Dissulfuribacterales bacterium]
MENETQNALNTPTDLKRLVRFLFEGNMLKRTWRTGYAFLGQGRESVAAHTFGVILMAFTLAREEVDIDELKLLKLCLIHDLPEARTGDANAVHKRYVTRHEDMAVADLTKDLGWGEEVAELFQEFQEKSSKEAMLAHDADQLDMILSLKMHLDTGSEDALRWLPHVKKRLVTPKAKLLAEAILQEHWACWWMNELIGTCE